MKLSRKRDRVNPGALQFSCQRLQFAARIRHRLVAVFRHNKLPVSDTDFEALQSRRNPSNRLIGFIQTSQRVRMVSFVQARCVQQHLKSS